jgi:uncharacterized protein
MIELTIMNQGKPESIIGRDREWGLLDAFLSDGRPGNRLAVVYGRRRQGKTMLLEAIATAHDAFYWEAAQQSRAQNLVSFSEAWSAFTESPGPIRFDSWEHALDIVLATSKPGRAVVFDEVGYIVESAPEFPSVLQRHFGPSLERSGSTKVVICGSIYSQMTRLLSAGAPLRGRHSLVVDLAPFDVIEAARFWGLSSNPDAAFRMHALVGGTPAYRRFAGDNAPRNGNVDAWVVRYLLDTASPLFNEGTLLVADDPTLVDKSLYWSVLGAIADGNRRRNTIAAALDRSPGSLGQPIDVLLAGQWIEQRVDPFHPRYSLMQLTEPMLRTHRVVIAPDRRRLAQGRAEAVWADAQPKVARLVYGPHLEWVANDWIMRTEPLDAVGVRPTDSGPGTLRFGKTANQVDIVTVAPGRNDALLVHAVGEVKADGKPMGAAQLERLDGIAARLGDRAAPAVRRVLVARRGFTAELRREASRRGDTSLIELDRIYDANV